MQWRIYTQVDAHVFHCGPLVGFFFSCRHWGPGRARLSQGFTFEFWLQDRFNRVGKDVCWGMMCQGTQTWLPFESRIAWLRTWRWPVCLQVSLLWGLIRLISYHWNVSCARLVWKLGGIVGALHCCVVKRGYLCLWLVDNTKVFHRGTSVQSCGCESSRNIPSEGFSRGFLGYIQWLDYIRKSPSWLWFPKSAHFIVKRRDGIWWEDNNLVFGCLATIHAKDFWGTRAGWSFKNLWRVL